MCVLLSLVLHCLPLCLQYSFRSSKNIFFFLQSRRKRNCFGSSTALASTWALSYKSRESCTLFQRVGVLGLYHINLEKVVVCFKEFQVQSTCESFLRCPFIFRIPREFTRQLPLGSSESCFSVLGYRDLANSVLYFQRF